MLRSPTPSLFWEAMLPTNWRAMGLLQDGYARHVFVDATTGITYGHSFVDLAKDYVKQTAGPYALQVSVLPSSAIQRLRRSK